MVVTETGTVLDRIVAQTALDLEGRKQHLPPEELRQAVLSMPPQRMDRDGHVATPEEYWQWFTELNPIRVADFERELRELGFEPWRVALRSSDLVEYTPELQRYAIQDLATAELYLSAWNRKA